MYVRGGIEREAGVVVGERGVVFSCGMSRVEEDLSNDSREDYASKAKREKKEEELKEEMELKKTK